MPQLKLIALHEFLVKQDARVIDELYRHPATCMSVFRELPQIAKHIIIRILFINQQIAKPLIESWVADEHREKFEVAMEIITGLRIWENTNDGIAFNLNNSFRTYLQEALFGGGETWRPAVETLGVDKNAKTIEQLDAYTKERWDQILSFLTQEQGKLSEEVISLLKYAGLCDANGEKRFQFLLLDRSSQVWYLLVQYLGYVQKLGLSLVNVLAFVLQLGYCSFGTDYPCDNSNHEIGRVIQHFREMGLIFKRKSKEQRFYPTRLAQSISIAGGKKASSEDVQEQFILVETNYRIYAYTDSELHFALISLFAEVQYRFPCMIVAQMSRDSIQQSADYGISAEQILNYLRSSAHPVARKNKHWVPQVVEDNIHLWCKERERLKFSDGLLYHQFLDQEAFEMLKSYAQDIRALVWANDERRFMVVAPWSHDQIKSYYKQIKDGMM